MPRNQVTVNIYSLMRQLVQEEIQKIFDPKNTFPHDLLDFGQAPTGGTPIRRRRRGSRGQTKTIKGRVTRPDDKRLKANREL